MKKHLFTLLLIFSILDLSAQTHTIEIHPNNRVASLLMSSVEYNNWISNDEFNNQTIREALFQDIYQKFDDEFDFIFLILNEDVRPSNLPYGQLIQVSNNVTGIGLSTFDNSSDYGSLGKLKSVMHLTRRDYLRLGPSLHELMHNWGNFGINTEGTFNGTDFFAFKPHWGFTGGSSKGQLGGFSQSTLVDNGAGSYSVESFGTNANGGNSLPYNQLELYLMGMIPIADIDDFDVFTGISNFNFSGNPYTFDATGRTTYTSTSLEALLTQRVPNSNTSQKDFRALVIILTDSALTSTQWNIVDDYSEKFSRTSSDFSSSYNFWEATNGLGTLKTDDLNNITLSLTDNNTSTNNIRIYPNPTDDYIGFSGLNSSQHYIIYDFLGKEIIKGMIRKNEKVDVKSLESGIYFILTETGEKIKFVKK
ncbi:T9SS type A sorting domain-containing protein [Bacteroidota bacterium]